MTQEKEFSEEKFNNMWKKIVRLENRNAHLDSSNAEVVKKILDIIDEEVDGCS